MNTAPMNATTSQRLRCMPGDNQRPRRSSVVAALGLCIAALHERLHALSDEVCDEVVREIDGSVAAARAADRDREVRFAFAYESGQQKIDEAVKFGLEFLGLFDGIEERDDLGMIAVECL